MPWGFVLFILGGLAAPCIYIWLDQQHRKQQGD